MNTYQVRFVAKDCKGINVQFEIEASTPEKAVSRALVALSKSCMSSTHCFESVSQKEGINRQVEAPNGDLVPLLDFPMMSDEKYAEMAKAQQEKHPEEYTEMLKQMREHPELYPGMIKPLDSFCQ